MATVTQSPIDVVAFETIPDAFRRYEVADGELVARRPMGNREASIGGELIYALRDCLGERGRYRVMGPEARFRLRMGPDRIRGADVSYMPPERASLDQITFHVSDIVPQLVAEIVSPSNGASEILGRVDEWLEAGVELVWVVFPELRRVYCYSHPDRPIVRKDGDDLDGGDMLPDFRYPVANLFPPRPKSEDTP